MLSQVAFGGVLKSFVFILLGVRGGEQGDCCWSVLFFPGLSGVENWLQWEWVRVCVDGGRERGAGVGVLLILCCILFAGSSDVLWWNDFALSGEGNVLGLSVSGLPL